MFAVNATENLVCVLASPAEYDTLFGEDKAYRALLEAKEQ